MNRCVSRWVRAGLGIPGLLGRRSVATRLLLGVAASVLLGASADADSGSKPVVAKPAAAALPKPEASASPKPAVVPPGRVADVFSDVARVVAIGDLHGDFDKFQQVLRLCQLTDAKDHWSAGKTHLVQTGDVLDRGPDSRRILDLLMQLEKEAAKAGGAVHALIGNHEFMNVVGDLRYVSDGELAAFADGPRQTPVGREPEGSFPKYRAAFLPSGTYGKWILSHNAIVRVNDTLFMHGGLSPRFINRKLSELNELVRAELRGERDARVGVGADPEGPLWYRGLAESMQEQVLQAYLRDLSAAQGAKRIVMGHTIQERGITLKADGRLALIDVGMSRWTLGAAPSCLVIERTGQSEQLQVRK